MITAVNPAIIQWARARSGLSLEDLAIMMKRDPYELQQWDDIVRVKIEVDGKKRGWL